MCRQPARSRLPAARHSRQRVPGVLVERDDFHGELLHVVWGRDQLSTGRKPPLFRASASRVKSERAFIFTARISHLFLGFCLQRCANCGVCSLACARAE